MGRRLNLRKLKKVFPLVTYRADGKCGVPECPEQANGGGVLCPAHAKEYHTKASRLWLLERLGGGKIVPDVTKTGRKKAARRSVARQRRPFPKAKPPRRPQLLTGPGEWVRNNGGTP